MYVGQTIVSIQKRWNRHCWACTAKYNNMPICYAIKKYGKENFTIKKICQCDTQVELDAAEIKYAKKYKTFSPNGYNLKAGKGRGSMSEETKRKISVANKGKQVSDETKEKLRISHLGYKMKDSTKKKLSQINKGKKPSLLARKRSSESQAKHYDLIDSEGIIHHIYNMKHFCEKHGYHRSRMCELVRGKRKQYRGWTVAERNSKLSII